MNLQILNFLAAYKNAAEAQANGRVRITATNHQNVLVISWDGDLSARYVITTGLTQVVFVPVNQFSDFWDLLTALYEYRDTKTLELEEEISTLDLSLSFGWHGEVTAKALSYLACTGMDMSVSWGEMQETISDSNLEPQIEWMTNATQEMADYPEAWIHMVRDLAMGISGAAINPLPILVHALYKEHLSKGMKGIYVGGCSRYLEFGVRNFETATFTRLEVLSIVERLGSSS